MCVNQYFRGYTSLFIDKIIIKKLLSLMMIEKKVSNCITLLPTPSYSNHIVSTLLQVYLQQHYTVERLW